MDSIVKIGSSEKIEECIEAELSINKEDAKKVFDFLASTYRENTSGFGCISPLGQELVVGGGQYYINMPKSVIMVIALLLDITLTKGIVSGVCGMLGIQAQVLYSMNQHKGEVCLFREYMRNSNILAENGFQYLIGKECVNNDLECKYRDADGRCCILEADIHKIFDHFKEAKIIN